MVYNIKVNCASIQNIEDFIFIHVNNHVKNLCCVWMWYVDVYKLNNEQIICL